MAYEWQKDVPEPRTHNDPMEGLAVWTHEYNRLMDIAVNVAEQRNGNATEELAELRRQRSHAAARMAAYAGYIVSDSPYKDIVR